jgi:hypothetical protein
MTAVGAEKTAWSKSPVNHSSSLRLILRYSVANYMVPSGGWCIEAFVPDFPVAPLAR